MFAAVNETPPISFWAFTAVWILLASGNTALLFLSKNAQLKRRVFPWATVLVGALFCVFMATITTPKFLLVIVPLVVLSCAVNIRMTMFCDSCGATLFHHNVFARLRYCSRCGASLQRAQVDR